MQQLATHRLWLVTCTAAEAAPEALLHRTSVPATISQTCRHAAWIISACVLQYAQRPHRRGHRCVQQDTLCLLLLAMCPQCTCACLTQPALIASVAVIPTLLYAEVKLSLFLLIYFMQPTAERTKGLTPTCRCWSKHACTQAAPTTCTKPLACKASYNTLRTMRLKFNNMQYLLLRLQRR
jgi:hypothetical protein